MIDDATLRALAGAATPGPWTWAEPEVSPQWGKRGPDLVGDGSQLVVSAEGDADGSNLFVGGRDAAFISAASPQAVLALLDELDRLRG